MAKTPAWQRAEGKSESGGLNEKGRASLRAAGHDIKRPQPEGGARKRSFCARMEGMKRENTSAETARDPDSRINKSLRKWNCADGGAVDPYDAVQQAAKGGPIWDRPRPKKLGKPEPLSSKEKASAKAAAKAAGRPYPNLIDNMRAARADGGPADDRAHEFVQEQLHSGEPQVPQYVAENDFPARAARGVEAVDTAASKVNNLLANVAGQPAMRSLEGRTASEIVQSAMPVDPYQAVQQAASQWREGDKLGAAETMASGMPMQGAIIHNQKVSPKIENLARTADKFVYHSGVSPDLPHMTPYLEPQHGSWIKEVASGAVDDPEAFLERAKPLVWLSDKPNWVVPKVGRHLNKYFSNVSDEDIRNVGHVAMVPRKGYEAENIWRVGESGLDEGPYSTLTNLRTGEPTKAYNTDIFEYGSEPFGVERNEYISAQPIEPMYHLTGDDLLKFLKLTKNRADGGQVEGDVQFADDDPYAKVQEAAKLPMMAQNDFAMRMPQPEVRYDTGPQPGEATLKSYDPTIKERIYQGIAGTEERPTPERAQFARGMSQMAEFAPVLGNVMAGQEAQRRGDTKGMLMAALPVPGMATEARMAEAAVSPAQEAAREAYQRVLNAQGLYSHAAEAAANLPQAKGSYEQMMAMLQKAGVKPEEMRWSGVEQFAGQPVTREQLVSHFEQNVPKIEETVLQNRPATPVNRSDALSQLESEFADVGVSGTPKFQQYTIPGGENYREVLLGLPSETKKLEARRREIEALGRNATEEQKSEWADIMNRLRPDDRDIEGIARYRGPAAEGEYHSQHWDQPNVLGHLRMSDRTGPEGEKILHLEELQSDWGQAGRKRGFHGEMTPPQETNRWQVIHHIDNGQNVPYSFATEQEAVDWHNHLSVLGLSLDRPTREFIPGVEKVGTVPPAPYVEKTQNWVDLGLKRALKEAAEGGYSKMVWTPGEEQAARYELSKQIRSMDWAPYDDGLKRVSLYPHYGNPIEFKINSAGIAGAHRPGQVLGTEFEGKHISDIVGKDMAEKILNDTHGDLYGTDLNVGGEGMKGFYDKIVPTRLKELLKKIDPQAKMSFTEIQTKDGPVKVPAIEITPKIREAVKRGLPAYAHGGEVVNNTDPYDNIRLKAKNFPRARRASN